MKGITASPLLLNLMGMPAPGPVKFLIVRMKVSANAGLLTYTGGTNLTNIVSSAFAMAISALYEVHEYAVGVESLWTHRISRSPDPLPPALTFWLPQCQCQKPWECQQNKIARIL